MKEEDQMEMELLDVFKLASSLHEGQLDKAGHPYIGHLVRVMLRVQAAGGDRYQKMAGLLHDSIEDGKCNKEGLLRAGVPAEAVELVVALTKPEGAEYSEYLRGVVREPGALLVKTADIDDNSDPDRLYKLPDNVAFRLSAKYARAREILAQAAMDLQLERPRG